MQVGIAHGACADHAFFSFAAQDALQQFRRILLYLDIFKGMLHLVAGAPAVAVNAAMGAAAVDIHAVLGG